MLFNFECFADLKRSLVLSISIMYLLKNINPGNIYYSLIDQLNLFQLNIQIIQYND